MTLKGFYALRSHQGKERAFFEALYAAGYRKTSNRGGNAKFLLYDLDTTGSQLDIGNLGLRGIPLFMYPHAARPMVQYDGIVPVNPNLRCLFTHALGGKEVMESFGFEKPVEVVGWSFCKILPFVQVNEVKHVTFAPIHPNGNGYLSLIDQWINQETFTRLKNWCAQNGAELKVRYLHTLEENGLQECAGVIWKHGAADQSTADIDTADIVVGHQTFAYLAVARGKPTLMMAEDIPPRSGNSDSNFRYVEHWELYRDRLMYPLDILNCDSVDALIKKAILSDELIRAWKNDFIGQPFDGREFVKRLESYL